MPNERSLWQIGLVASLAAVIALVAVVAAGQWLSPRARREIVRQLEAKYASQVQFEALDISLFPYPKAVGRRFILRQSPDPDVPPLIAFKQFTAETGWVGLFQSPRRIRSVRLEGLEIRIARGKGGGQHPHGVGRIVIEQIVADGALLEILPKKEGKQPLVFDIYKLKLKSVAPGKPMHYDAELKNAKPPGLIQASGEFGPWQTEAPAQTPVTGDFRFLNANLGVFKGISGTLSSTGRFQGVLDRIEVSGHTTTPDFTVSAGGHPMRLDTTYSATVDGSNGDTLLHPVVGRFGGTTVTASGGIAGKPGEKGKTVSLDAVVQDGDLADVLRLGVKSDPPPMTGRISFRSKIEIPHGDRDIAEKLYLNGDFEIATGRFTNPALRQKLAALSQRARGIVDSSEPAGVASGMRGHFVLRNGEISLTNFSFTVPGARIHLNGTYGLHTEKLDFRGTAATDAKLSQMTTGVKSALLKVLDPFFAKHHAGAVIPIHIGGTRKEPSFGLDLK